MRGLFATICIALALAGCRGAGEGLFGQLTIPPPGTQPPGTLLAGNSYYPGRTTTASAATPTPLASTTDSRSTSNLLSVPTSSSSSNSPTERRGASLSRANLGTPSRTAIQPSSEEPIRIPSESPAAGALAAVVPIRGIPTTDATTLFDTVRSQLGTRGFLEARTPAPSRGFLEISQLPDASPALRQAALSRQTLR